MVWPEAPGETGPTTQHLLCAPSRMSSACRRPWVSGIPPDLPLMEAWRTSSDVVPPRSSMVAFRCWPPWDTSPQWLGFSEAAIKIVQDIFSFSKIYVLLMCPFLQFHYSWVMLGEPTRTGNMWQCFFLNAFRWNNPQEITGKFPGYLSPSAGLKFADVPNGLAAISKVPAAGQGWNNWSISKSKPYIYIYTHHYIYNYIYIIYIIKYIIMYIYIHVCICPIIYIYIHCIYPII